MSEREQAVSRFPLEWPAGWVRTPAHRRRGGIFTHGKQPISIFQATGRLEAELDRLGAHNPTLSTNVSLRLDGQPRSNERPRDPGAAVYFRFKGKATVFACDRYDDVAQNIAAIAGHVEALRRIERYGVGSLEQALAGYKALPADTAANWRAVFGFGADARVTREALETAYRERAKTAHPDRGGSDEQMMHVNRAHDYALAELNI